MMCLNNNISTPLESKILLSITDVTAGSNGGRLRGACTRRKLASPLPLRLEVRTRGLSVIPAPPLTYPHHSLYSQGKLFSRSGPALAAKDLPFHPITSKQKAEERLASAISGKLSPAFLWDPLLSFIFLLPL